jgi:hypothetical protein
MIARPKVWERALLPEEPGSRVTPLLHVGRRLGAIVPLTILTLVFLAVAIAVIVVPTKGRRECALDLVRELTKFAAVLVRDR